MKVLVCGSSGCVGSAVVRALRSRGHAVVSAARGEVDGPRSLRLDFMQPRTPAVWAERLRSLQLDAIVNCVGILMPSRGQRFERVHRDGPIELFRGAALAGVPRVLQISALGVGDDPAALASPYLHSKRVADDSLASTAGLDWAVLRPSLVFGPGSQSARLFATLAALPVVSLPGRGEQALAPIHVYELAEIVARLLERNGALRQVFELGGAQALSYREMLMAYRSALGLNAPLWLPLPMPLMRASAWLAEALPQQVLCRHTIAMLERGSVPGNNATAALLGRAPSTLAQGLRITPPEPLVQMRAELSPGLALTLRAALAFMWLQTAFISALLPEASGVLHLLARCGFSGDAGWAMLVVSCSLNTVLGTLTLRRHAAWAYALQAAAIVGYSSVAAFNMPELTIDHCAPLAKNLPLLAAVLVLWLDAQRATAQTGRGVMSALGRSGALIPQRSAEGSPVSAPLSPHKPPARPALGDTVVR